MKVLLTALTAVLALCRIPAFGQDDVIAKLPPDLTRHVTAEMSRDAFRATILELAHLPPFKNSPPTSIIGKRGLSAVAVKRANAIESVLRNDLSGDLEVTEAEIRAADQYLVDAHLYNAPTPAMTEREVASTMRYDLDADGRVTIAEITEFQRQKDAVVSYSAIRALIDLDPNEDGEITANELRILSDNVFDAIDQNRDGTIGAEESEGLHR